MIEDQSSNVSFRYNEIITLEPTPINQIRLEVDMGIMRTFNKINLQYKCTIIFTQEPRWFVRISREYLLRDFMVRM